jgi:hypothetical protein
MPLLLLHNATCKIKKNNDALTTAFKDIISSVTKQFISYSFKLHLERSGVSFELVLDETAVSSTCMQLHSTSRNASRCGLARKE